jgi:Rrf2 family cysteine metabolism transcriptional repressor
VKLSKRSEYACLAIIDLAQNQGDGLCTIHDISARRSIPRKYLEQILLTLRRSGYLTSKIGAGGGYRLARPASRISVAEVIRLMDGALAPVGSVSRYFYQPTPIEQSRKLSALMREIRDYISDKLEKTTFADMA